MNIKKDILHVIPSLNPKYGGPSFTVTEIASITVDKKHQFQIEMLTQSLEGDSVVFPENNKVVVGIEKSKSKIDLYLGLPIYRALNKILPQNKPSIVFGHGIWHPANHWTARYARQNNIPYILHSHGMLEPWALSHHAWRKKFAGLIYQNQDIGSADVLIASSIVDYENLRRLGYKHPIAIIPHGVKKTEVKQEFLEDTYDKSSLRTVLFLSRIHPKKGVLELVESWGKLKRVGWKLLIAGPDDRGHKAVVQSRIKQLHLEDSIHFLGELEGQDKWREYHNADLFVLPTYSENFGMVIVEALSCGTPVITTKGTPWADLEKFECGWWIDMNIESITECLNSAMSLPDYDRKLMGERGAAYVKSFNWDAIALQFIDLYK